MIKKSFQNFKKLEISEKGMALLAFSNKTQIEILKKLKVNEIVEILKYLDPTRTSKILRKLPTHKKARAIKKLEENIQEKIKMLLKFRHESIGAILSFDYIQVKKTDTVDDLHKLLCLYARQSGKVPALLVIENGNLVGEVSLKDILVAKKNHTIVKLIKKNHQIHCDENEEEALNLFKKHPHSKIAVLSDDGSILGILHADDILPY